MFCKSADGEDGRDGGEHALVDAEHKGGYFRTRNRGLSKHTLEGKVACRQVLKTGWMKDKVEH